MSHLSTEIAQKLKEARQEAHLKQRQVAEFLNVSVSAISALESGQRRLDAEELFLLSKLYGKPMTWFFNDPHPLTSAEGSRWYDTDPLVRECMVLLKNAPKNLQRRAAYGLLGFLSER